MIRTHPRMHLVSQLPGIEPRAPGAASHGCYRRQDSSAAQARAAAPASTTGTPTTSPETNSTVFPVLAWRHSSVRMAFSGTLTRGCSESPVCPATTTAPVVSETPDCSTTRPEMLSRATMAESRRTIPPSEVEMRTSTGCFPCSASSVGTLTTRQLEHPETCVAYSINSGTALLGGARRTFLTS